MRYWEAAGLTVMRTNRAAATARADRYRALHPHDPVLREIDVALGTRRTGVEP